MKKLVTLLLVLALTTALALTACAEPAARTFTDSVGREVTVPQEIERIAISGPLAQIVVFALAPDKLVGIASEWDATAEQYLATEYYQLPLLGQLYGTKGEMNLETLLAAAPQVVIDVGEPKEGIVEDLNALTEQTGIPFVHITMALESMDETYMKLGELLGLEEEAAVLAAYCREVYDRTAALSKKVDKTRLLYITGETGMGVIARDSYHSPIIDMLSENLAVVDSPSSKGTGNETDIEQILEWNPDAILFSSRSTYEQAQTDPLWQAVSAVASDEYYLVPQTPYNWMGFPPSAQRFLGMMWMGKVLYGEQAEYDLYEEVARYFDLFYHCSLTREQFDALTADSVK